MSHAAPTPAGDLPHLADPAVLARIGDLELVARGVVDGFVSGLHRSPHLGLSTDFAEHRQYSPGDDVRRVDWRLMARTDRYYVKEFEAETNAAVTVLLDISRSMAYGSRGITKLEYARMLAACLLHFSQRQRDRVGLALFDHVLVDVVPPSVRHLPLVLHTLARARAGGAGSLAAPLRDYASAHPRRAIVVVISDLYEEPGVIADAMHALRGRGSDVMLWHVLDPAELDFPFSDAASFRDLEGEEVVPVIPDQLRARYRELVAAHVAAIEGGAGAAGVDYHLFDTRRPLGEALHAYLASRERMLGGRAAAGGGGWG